jgi:hypothetical protein
VAGFQKHGVILEVWGRIPKTWCDFGSLGQESIKKQTIPGLARGTLAWRKASLVVEHRWVSAGEGGQVNPDGAKPTAP